METYPCQMEIYTRQVEKNLCQVKMYLSSQAEIYLHQMEIYTSEAETALWRLFAPGA